MNPYELTEDAKAILLLCGRFGKQESNGDPKPLSIQEYNQVADLLKSRAMRPADLIDTSAEDVLSDSRLRIDRQRIHKLINRGASLALALEKWLNKGIWIVCRSDADYPARLKHHLRKSAPPILFGVGDVRLLSLGGLAVVGSRNIDQDGEKFTRKIGSYSARHSIQTVSGGARGVDQFAMISALESGGTVVGVLADKLLKSAVSGKYRSGILEKRLVLISPYHPESPFNVGNAMNRNKVIYALADCALIVNTSYKKGGTWAGAEEELKRSNSKQVFVRDIENAANGNKELIKLGALPFPKLPWPETLEGLLKGASDQKRSVPANQLSLFEERFREPVPAEMTVKEAAYEYPAVGTAEVFKDEHTELLKDQIPTTIYGAILPLLLKSLSEWKTPKELVEILNVRKNQLDDWLKQALDEGWVEKKTKPIRYRKEIK